MSENTTPTTPDVQVTAPQTTSVDAPSTKVAKENALADLVDNSIQNNTTPSVTDADAYTNEILEKIRKEQESIIIRMVKMMIRAVTKFLFAPGDKPSRDQFNAAMSERLDYATAAMCHDLSDLEQTLESRFLNKNMHMDNYLEGEFKLYQENPTKFNEKYRQSLGGDLEPGLDRDQWDLVTKNMYAYGHDEFLPHKESQEAAVEYHGKTALLSLVRESLELSSQHLSEQVRATGSIKKGASVHGNDTKGLLEAKLVMDQLTQQVLPLVHDSKGLDAELTADQDKAAESKPFQGGLAGFFKRENRVAEMDPEKRDAINAWLSALKEEDKAYMKNIDARVNKEGLGNNYRETVLRNLPSHRALTAFADEIANVAIGRTVEIAGKAQKFEIDVLPGAADYVRNSIKMGLNPGSDHHRDNADDVFSTKGGQSKHNQFDDVDRHHLDEISNFFQGVTKEFYQGNDTLLGAYEALEKERAERLQNHAITERLRDQDALEISEKEYSSVTKESKECARNEHDEARAQLVEEEAKTNELSATQTKPEETSPEQSGP